MGINIRLYGIVSEKPFTLSYKTGLTAGNESVIATGYTSYSYGSNLSGGVYSPSTVRNYNTNPIIFTGGTYDTQYWFKLTYTGDTGDVNYIIENITTHEIELYEKEICCFYGGSSQYIIPTPTPSPTPILCIFSGGTASFQSGPTPTPTPVPPTPTPTPVPPTPTPTPSPEPVNTDLYYYYALGDCTQMGYETTQITNTGLGIITITGLCSSYITDPFSDPAHTSYYTDYSNPCGFASGYTYSSFGKSLKTNAQIPEGTVYTIGDQCLSVVHVDPSYVPPVLSTVSLDGLTPESGDNPCYTCQPPFTGLTFNWYVYGATRCDNPSSNILVYSIFPYLYDATPYAPGEFGLPKLSSLQTGLTYSMVTYDSNGDVIDDGYCATITSYYGAFTGQTVQVPILPLTDPVYYKNLPVGAQAVEGHYSADCSSCSPLYYYNFTERCDGQFSMDNDPIWSTVKLNTNDIIKDDMGICRKVTYPGTYKELKYKGYYQSQTISMVGTKYTNNNCSSCS